MKKRKTHEIDELLKRKAEEAKGGFKKKRKQREVKQKLTLTDKRALKKEKVEDKKRKEEDKLLEEFQVDNVAFGEVVHGPPNLKTKPRHAEKIAGAPRVISYNESCKIVKQLLSMNFYVLARHEKVVTPCPPG